MPEFLLPFRKPKRIRTAFSPSQLLKLEQAFEKNQYVVGAERKELAKHLNLSETQVRNKTNLAKKNCFGFVSEETKLPYWNLVCNITLKKNEKKTLLQFLRIT